MQTNRRTLVVVAVVYLVAIALWAGGLTVLGAIVAPTVFGIVPAPTSADAMTVVFGRFDRVAMACAAVALVAEGMLARAGQGKPSRVDALRAAALVASGGLAIAVGAWLSPAITALHRAGAVRGLGPEGTELERLHGLAEFAGKGQLVLLLVVLALVVIRLTRPPASSSRLDNQGERDHP